jgi:DNA polymerase III subunit alpha
MTFVHLHNHSYYSLMDGLSSPRELLETAKEFGQPAMAITDHGTLSAHREFQIAAKELGVKPILGLEAYISPTDRFDRRSVKKRDDNTQAYNHIILLAKDRQGYLNLNRLSELAWTEGFYSKPRIDREVLEEYRAGLIVLSGCMNGLIAKEIERENRFEARKLTAWFQDTFGSDFYMEIQPHNPIELNRELIKLATEFDVQPVVTGDCHYANEEDKWREEAMLILSTNPKQSTGATYELFKKTGGGIKGLDALYPERPISFKDIDVFVADRDHIEKALIDQGIDPVIVAAACNSTLRIADKIGDYEFHEGLDLLPQPAGNANDILTEKAWAGLKARGLDKSQPHIDRMNEELGIIIPMGFAAYMLTVEDAVSWAKSHSIRVGPGRGSAVSSLVCYSLGITGADPLEHNLLFFRFINPERMESGEFPDIDTDFEDRRRGEVKDYVRRKYGHVASIATFTKFQGKNSVRDASRVFRVPLGAVNSALKGADYPPNVDFFAEWMKLPQAREFARNYPEAVDLARYLHGRVRSIGVHAGGIVLSKEPLTHHVPIQTAKDTQDEAGGRIPVVAYDMEAVAKIGLIKEDFLGLKALSTISDTLDVVKERHGKAIDLDNLPLDDPKVYEMLSQGYTRGVFQCEKGPYTNLLLKIGGVKNFDELVASNALVRPGAADSTAGADFVARKSGKQIPSYPHKDMTWFTKETYGTIIYQEQVMLTMTELAGMSMGTADKVRKIIGKKRDVKEFEAYKQEFIDGCSEKVSGFVAGQLWHDFEAHANYSFNKSHAVAYSILSYWTAWLKVHYPIEYVASMLKNEKNKDTRLDYLIEAKRLGLRIKLPHVNESGLDFQIGTDEKGDFIQFGLSNVKYISDKVGKTIMEHRPFQNYSQLYDKVMEKGSGLSTRVLQSLNAIGGAAFEDNPRNGRERENFYEYLAVPAFEMKDLPPKVKTQFRLLEDFDPDAAFMTMAMVRGIKRGKGWALLDLVDETGSAGVFTDENTPIEPGNMYVLLVASNRVARYMDLADLTDDEFQAPLKDFIFDVEYGDVPQGMMKVVSFKSRTTKAGKKMADAVFADHDKNLHPAMVFPQQFHKAFGQCKDGAVVDVQFDQTDSGATFVRNIL